MFDERRKLEKEYDAIATEYKQKCEELAEIVERALKNGMSRCFDFFIGHAGDEYWQFVALDSIEKIYDDERFESDEERDKTVEKEIERIASMTREQLEAEYVKMKLHESKEYIEAHKTKQMIVSRLSSEIFGCSDTATSMLIVDVTEPDEAELKRRAFFTELLTKYKILRDMQMLH